MKSGGKTAAEAKLIRVPVIPPGSETCLVLSIPYLADCHFFGALAMQAFSDSFA